MEDTYKISIGKRPWYVWLGWLVWAFLVLFTLQNALASSVENEPAARTIFWAVEIVLLIAGAIVYYVRRRRIAA